MGNELYVERNTHGALSLLDSPLIEEGPVRNDVLQTLCKDRIIKKGRRRRSIAVIPKGMSI